MNGAGAQSAGAFNSRGDAMLAWLSASLIATLAAAAVATIFFVLITTGAIGLLSLLTITIPVVAMMSAAILAAPITFGLLPAIAVLLARRHHGLLTYILPAAGCLGGAFFIATQVPLWQFVATGLVAGLVAGIVYARRVRQFDVRMLPDITPAHARIAARFTLRQLGYIGAYLVLGSSTSAVAAVCGTFFVFLAGMGWAGAIAVVAIPLIPYFGIPIGFMLSMPVTFVVLPLLSLVLSRYPATRLFMLGVSGAVTGGCVTWWWIGLAPKFAALAPAFVASGTAAGLVAGMMYAAMVRGLQK